MADDKKAIGKANRFCKRMKAENKLRNAIADITAKLNRSNLSPEEGERHARSLVKAYRRLNKLEKAIK